MAKADISPHGKARAWQRMLSGRRLDLLDPSPLDVEIADIAHGLARVARWNGQTYGENAYSVAQHSLFVESLFSKLLPQAAPEEKLLALLHDGAEYVLGDIISPFKAVMGGEYRRIEDRLQNAIHIRFSLPTTLSEKTKKIIKQADEVSAYFEAIYLAGFSPEEAEHYFGHPHHVSVEDKEFLAQPTSVVEKCFLERFYELEGARQ